MGNPFKVFVIGVIFVVVIIVAAIVEITVESTRDTYFWLYQRPLLYVTSVFGFGVFAGISYEIVGRWVLG